MNAYNEFKALPVAERDAICRKAAGMSEGSPTTDRDDAAMMVEKVRDCGRMPDLLMPIMLEGLPNSFLEAVEIGLCADPCLIAWAACVALEDA